MRGEFNIHGCRKDGLEVLVGLLGNSLGALANATIEFVSRCCPPGYEPLHQLNVGGAELGLRLIGSLLEDAELVGAAEVECVLYVQSDAGLSRDAVSQRDAEKVVAEGAALGWLPRELVEVSVVLRGKG